MLLKALINNAVYHKCITLKDVIRSTSFVESMKKYDYVKYRKL